MVIFIFILIFTKTEPKTMMHRKRPSTNSKHYQDRFIPCRNLTHCEDHSSFYSQSFSNPDVEPYSPFTSSLEHYDLALMDQLYGSSFRSHKVLQFSSNGSNKFKRTIPRRTADAPRHVPDKQYKMLDAQDLRDDVDAHDVDWSVTGLLCVILYEDTIYMMSPHGSIESIEPQGDAKVPYSIHCSPDGNNMAVLSFCGSVCLYDYEKATYSCRLFDPIPTSTYTICWNPTNPNVITAGTRNGHIIEKDLRQPNNIRSYGATNEYRVRCLSWSHDGTMLASGYYSDTFQVWDSRFAMGPMISRRGSAIAPKRTFSDNSHKSTVKSLSWCPFRRNILATGSMGTSNSIKIWNTGNKDCLRTLHMESGVTCLDWSSEYRELISSTNGPHNNLRTFKYPHFEKTSSITATHKPIKAFKMDTTRENICAVCPGLELLTFWNMFPKKKQSITDTNKVYVNNIR